ncbi:MAG: cation:proton antiporter, partial [Rhodomicrobium sp.]
QLNFRLALFAAAMLAAVWSIPKIAPFIMRNEPKGSEAGTRFLVFVLFLLGGLGSVSGTEAVVPAYLIGVVLAPLLQKEEAMAGRLKSAAFAWFTPFYFLRTGSLLDLTQWPAIAVMTGSLLAIKIASKCAAVVPLARMFNIGARDAWSIAMLMSTGLTFGTVAAFLGLARNIIDAQQYAILVTAVIASGTIPALVAQRLLKPEQDYSCADRASGP